MYVCLSIIGHWEGMCLCHVPVMYLLHTIMSNGFIRGTLCRGISIQVQQLHLSRGVRCSSSDGAGTCICGLTGKKGRRVRHEGAGLHAEIHVDCCCGPYVALSLLPLSISSCVCCSWLSWCCERRWTDSRSSSPSPCMAKTDSTDSR